MKEKMTNVTLMNANLPFFNFPVPGGKLQSFFPLPCAQFPCFRALFVL